MKTTRKYTTRPALLAGLTLVVGLSLTAAHSALAVTAEETGFAVPGNVHRGGGGPLQPANAAGMPATVQDFLAGQGQTPATVDSLHVRRQMQVGKSGQTVVDFSQEVQGLPVYGAGLRAIFNGDGDLIAASENVVAAGPVRPAAIGFRAALDAALAGLYPNRAFQLSDRGGSADRARFGGDSFFYKDPEVSHVAIPMPGAGLQVGFLVETWSDDGNQLDYSLVGGDGRVLKVQNRTANDSYNVFPVHPDATLQIPVQGPGAGDGSEPSPGGWLDGGSQTSQDIQGNNVHAYLDRNNDNGPDGTGASVSNDDFDTPADLANGSDPTDFDNQDVAVQNLFYLNNLIHDVLYSHGFTEAKGNFQNNNFGNGGSGSDSVNAEAQDGGGTDNANFATPDDGQSPRMQMYLWNVLADRAVTGEFDDSNNVGELYLAGHAAFGDAVPQAGIGGPLFDLGDGCTVNFGATGAVALVTRGGACSAFTDKVKTAQDSGAVAAIVINNASDDILNMSGTDGSIHIPSVFVGQTHGAKLRAAVGATAKLVINTVTHRDGDLDADIVWHEYGHGLTWRTIGNMDGYMGGSLGEGASDGLSIVMTNDDRTGEYATGSGGGIRSAPYDGYYETTGRTYESVADSWGDVHLSGEIYAAIIWDMWQRYVQAGGCTDPTDPGYDGCIAAAKSQMMDDMVLGATETLPEGYPSTTFPAMRNGILRAIGGTNDANYQLTDSQGNFNTPEDANDKDRWCDAWRAFAKFGVGTDQTTTVKIRGIRITWSWTNGFAIPADCETTNPGNTPPTAVNDSASTTEDKAVTIDVLANDSDTDGGTLSITGVSNPPNGSVTNNGGNSVTYTPDPNFNGSDSFTYTISDGQGGSDSATVTVTVTAVNDAPVADDQSVATTTDTPVAITLTASDVDGDPLTYTVTTQPSHGSLSGTAPNLTYTPGSGYTGSDSFKFHVNDGTVDSADATVTITISAPSPITLQVTGTKVKGTKTATLTWSGATSSNVDVIRDGVTVATTANDGEYTEMLGKGGGTYVYQVCEAGTTICSDTVTVAF